MEKDVSRMMMSVTLNSPLTEEDLDKVYDVDMDNTDSVTFRTKHGKEVEFVKPVRCKDCKYWEKTSNEKGYCKDIIGFGRWWKGNDYCSYGVRNDG